MEPHLQYHFKIPHSTQLHPKMSKRKAPQGENPNKDICDMLFGEIIDDHSARHILITDINLHVHVLFVYKFIKYTYTYIHVRVVQHSE